MPRAISSCNAFTSWPKHQNSEPRQNRADPDMGAGCSLAESITGADVRALREAYPSADCDLCQASAAVKAESERCCTSSNAKKIVEAMGTDVLCIPDEFLAQNIAQETMSRLLHGKDARSA